MMSFVSRGITVENMKSVSIEQISAKTQGVLELKQSSVKPFQDAKPPSEAGPNSLVFASTPALFAEASQKAVAGLILTNSLYNSVKNSLNSEVSVWTTQNIQQAMSAVLPLFDRISETYSGVHPTAVIHPTAKIGNNVKIGAYVVVEAMVEVGSDCLLQPFVYVGSYCKIGQNCRIGPHVTIGSDGFGFFTDKAFNHSKIPQVGIVVIEDNCEFGAHCAIDRATLSETRIKRGSKFDNFCHIAHNVQIGENAMVTAGFIVAGSTVIGKNLMTSGGTHVLGHLNIPDNVILGPRSGVLQSIESSGMYSGYPLEPYKESVKTLLSIPHLKKLRKQVAKIMKHLNLSDEES